MTKLSEQDFQFFITSLRDEMRKSYQFRCMEVICEKMDKIPHLFSGVTYDDVAMENVKHLNFVTSHCINGYVDKNVFVLLHGKDFVSTVGNLLKYENPYPDFKSGQDMLNEHPHIIEFYNELKRGLEVVDHSDVTAKNGNHTITLSERAKEVLSVLKGGCEFRIIISQEKLEGLRDKESFCTLSSVYGDDIDVSFSLATFLELNAFTGYAFEKLHVNMLGGVEYRVDFEKISSLEVVD